MDNNFITDKEYIRGVIRKSTLSHDHIDEGQPSTDFFAPMDNVHVEFWQKFQANGGKILRCHNRQDADDPHHCLADELAAMALPNGIELYAKQFGYELYVGPLLIHPWPRDGSKREGLRPLMDIGSQNLRQSEGIDDGIETFRFLIATMGLPVNDEEVNLFRTPQLMEELYLLTHPLRLC